MGSYYLTWEQVFEALAPFDKSDEIVYGVPKGGMILTSFLKNASVTVDAGKATLILDDILDSGDTVEHYRKHYPNTAIIPLFYTSEFEGRWAVFPWEAEHPSGIDSIQDNVKRQLQYIGEDPARDGLRDTPRRVVKSWDEIFSGYNADIEGIMSTFDAEEYDSMVVLRDIELYSMCEHHLIPFYGKAHVAYIPKEKNKVIGISKLARLVDVYARRLQTQERITNQVTGALMHYLNPLGAGCVIEASHMCMRMRGVSKQNSTMITSSLEGVFQEHAVKDEFLKFIGK